MKQVIFLSTLIIIIANFSCQKEYTNSGEPPVITNPADSGSSQKKIKVWHGVRSAGTVPKPAGSAAGPVIEAPGEDFIHAFAGKFALIKPVVKSGNISGYYVTIKGASDYFKVDYKKPLITERHIQNSNKKQPKSNLFGLRPDSTGGNSYIDSAIVLILPPNFQTPDTFCVTYSAYDELGNISDAVSSCIIVSKPGGDASTNWLQASWRFYYVYDDLAQNLYDTIPYNNWIVPNYAFDEYIYCNTLASGVTQISKTCDSPLLCDYLNIDGDFDYQVKFDLLFNNNGGLIYIDSALYKRVDSIGSTCTLLNYKTISHNSIINGGWTVTGDKMIIVLEFDEDGNPVYEAWEFTLKKISDTEFWLIDNSEPGHNMYQDLRML